MQRTFLFLFNLIVFLYMGTLTIKADVLGPYELNSPQNIPEGYAGVTVVIASNDPINHINIIVADENGNQYDLCARNPSKGSEPYVYHFALGTYRVLSINMNAPEYKINCNMGNFEVGSTFTVEHVGGYIIITKK